MYIKQEKELFYEVNVLLDTYGDFINSSDYEKQPQSYKDAYKKIIEDKIDTYYHRAKGILTLQRESDGKNIGMRAAEMGLEETTIKALYSDIASTQVDKFGRNIGIYSAINGLKLATYIALQNPEAKYQEDIYGGNIEFYESSYEHRKSKEIISPLKEPFNKIMQEIKDLATDKKTMSDPKKRAIAEQKILNMIEKDDRVLIVQDHNFDNIGTFAAYYGLENIALRALDNGEASVQQNSNGMNIGMICATNQLRTATMKALDNPVASIQQSEDGSNIGMYATQFKMEDCSLKAMQNPIASLQVNFFFENMGIIAAKKHLPKATEEALKNETACQQETSRKLTIYDYIEKSDNTSDENILDNSSTEPIK